MDDKTFFSMFGRKKRTVAHYADGLYNLDGDLMRMRRQKNRPLTDKSAEIRTGLIKNYVIPLWGNLKVSDLTVKRIDEGLLSLRSVRDKKELAGNTKNVILTILNDVCAAAMEDRIISGNLAKEIMRFSRELTYPRGSIPQNEMALLFPPSHDDLIRIWRRQVFATAFLVLRDTGIRPGELRELQWGDWYLDDTFFPITKAIESGKRDKIKGTKTGSVKPAVVTDRTVQEIEKLRRKVKNISPEKFIFGGSRGPFSIDRLVNNFRAGVQRAGLNHPEYTPYWLRHTFNTRSLDDFSDETVRLMMGHKTEAMTLHYRHPDIESLKREARKIKQMMPGLE